MIDHHTALIYSMVLVSAADRDMTDAELGKIGEMVKYLPVFDDYDDSKLTSAAQGCAGLLTKDDGLQSALDLILTGLPEKLRETAYVLACDIAAVDGKASDEELAMVELIGERLEIEPLAATAIERAARARHARV
jgi:tellurite resistance protein